MLRIFAERDNRKKSLFEVGVVFYVIQSTRLVWIVITRELAVPMRIGLWIAFLRVIPMHPEYTIRVLICLTACSESNGLSGDFGFRDKCPSHDGTSAYRFSFINLVRSL